jgi:hypothetical protein
MNRAGCTAVLLFCGLALRVPTSAHAQSTEGAAGPFRTTTLADIGGPADDAQRLRQILGRAGTEGYLLRSPSSELARADTASGRFRWALISPRLELGLNSALPLSLNDGPLWAGKGTNLQLTTGAVFRAGRVTLVLAPQLTYAENRAFQIFPGAVASRSAFSSPWYLGNSSVDLPLRFGDRPLTELHPGQSTLAVGAGPVSVGASTENQWWGPGIRNAIVISNQAEGFPHLFLRTARPLRTRAGVFEGKWIVGGLVESLFFDTLSRNDVRSLSGVIGSYRPAPVPDLTLGVARVVYGPVGGASGVPGRALDALTWWGKEAVFDSLTGSAARPDPARPGREQILSLFARYLFPADGLELYAEWARLALPSSFADLINQPDHTQGYTLGLQWARPVRDSAVFRLQAEATYLEESASFDNRPGAHYYVSGVVPQGYTHRGQVVGASIGPGASSQWLAGDYVARSWRAGLFANRIRWNDDIYYAKVGRTHLAHDVSVFAGLRAGGTVWRSFVQAELSRELRYNYLFQNAEIEPFGHLATDVRNTSLRLTVTPRF